MPALQLHQLRVAAAGKLVCDNSHESINERAIVLACLFHDMGNIIKSDLAMFPEFLEPEGHEYWQKVKDGYASKYGTDEHTATAAIARELRLPDGAIRCIEGIGFSKLVVTRDSGAYERKIAEYSDLRVGPRGVLPMRARIEEARKRYVGKHPDMPASTKKFDGLVAAARDIERQIFVNAAIKPEDITDASIAPLIEQLWEYPVS